MSNHTSSAFRSSLLFLFFLLVSINISAQPPTPQLSPTPSELTIAKDIAATVQSGMTILALLVGGFWAYFKFVKGRLYKLRLEPKISGTIILRDGKYYLTADIQVKNVGLSKVEIKTAGTSVTVSRCDFTRTGIKPKLEWIDTDDVLTDHPLIEPGELTEEAKLLSLPGPLGVAYELRLRIVSKDRWLAGSEEWNVNAFVPLPLETEGGHIMRHDPENLITTIIPVSAHGIENLTAGYYGMKRFLSLDPTLHQKKEDKDKTREIEEQKGKK